MFETLEAAISGQVSSHPGGKIITGTSRGGGSVSFSLPSSASEMTPTKVLRAYVALRSYAREVGLSLSLDINDANNNATIADNIESVLLYTEQGDPDYSMYRG